MGLAALFGFGMEMKKPPKGPVIANNIFFFWNSDCRHIGKQRVKRLVGLGKIVCKALQKYLDAAKPIRQVIYGIQIERRYLFFEIMLLNIIITL